MSIRTISLLISWYCQAIKWHKRVGQTATATSLQAILDTGGSVRSLPREHAAGLEVPVRHAQVPRSRCLPLAHGWYRGGQRDYVGHAVRLLPGANSWCQLLVLLRA